MSESDKDSALEFAAQHFENYGLSHLAFGHPWTGTSLAEALRASRSASATNSEPESDEAIRERFEAWCAHMNLAGTKRKGGGYVGPYADWCWQAFYSGTRSASLSHVEQQPEKCRGCGTDKKLLNGPCCDECRINEPAALPSVASLPPALNDFIADMAREYGPEAAEGARVSALAAWREAFAPSTAALASPTEAGRAVDVLSVVTNRLNAAAPTPRTDTFRDEAVHVDGDGRRWVRNSRYDAILASHDQLERELAEAKESLSDANEELMGLYREKDALARSSTGRAFSDFIRNASHEEKADVYFDVMAAASDRQRALWLADKLVGDYGSEAAQLLRRFASAPSATLTTKTGGGIVPAVAVSAKWLVHVHDRYSLGADGACAQCSWGAGVGGWVCYYHQAKALLASPDGGKAAPKCTDKDHVTVDGGNTCQCGKYTL